MLSESEEAKSGKPFHETALFQKCREMGIIPRGPEDLQRPKTEKAKKRRPVSGSQGGSPPIPSEAAAPEGLFFDARISGMWCPACAWLIEEAARKAPGVKTASCHFSTDRFRCCYDPVKTSPGRIIGRIERLGYKAVFADAPGEEGPVQGEWVRMIVSAFLTMNIMMFSFALYIGFLDPFSKETVFKLSLPVFLMAAGVLFYGGKEIFTQAAAGIRNAAFGMETLIAAGALTAFVYSTVNLTRGSLHLYYDTAAMLVTLVLIGKRMESKAKSRVQSDLDHFFSLVPNKVRLITDAYPEGRYGSVRALNPGDRFRVEPGEITAADGIILDGTGLVDESALTGEPRPVGKTRSDPLRSGSKIIQGVFTVRAEAVGKASVFGQMLTLMEDALAQKGHYEARAETLLRRLVPGIFMLATGIVFLLLLSGHTPETAVIRGITVIVITCPCALGVAIPLARTAGASLLLKQGILLRDFSALGQVRRIKTVVFDKTGTLTRGRWRLQKIVTEDGFDPDAALGLAAALESDVPHFIASEILEHAQQKRVAPAAVKKIHCFQNGISGKYRGREIKIGSMEFVGAQKGNPESQGGKPVGLESAPRTDAFDSKVFLAVEGKIAAVFIFSDPVRSKAAETVSRLKAAGYRVVLVSGDNPAATRAVAKALDIPEAFGGLLPAIKAEWVKRLQKETGPAAMVGDGINDAPAMVQADLAVAMYSGSPLGKEASHVTLMRSDPMQFLDFIETGKRILKKMHQNLGWAFIYNVLAVPVAAAGLLTPVIAVCAMLASSLSVIGNTLLLMKNPTGSKYTDLTEAGKR